MPTAVVTGANRGIGLELCKGLKARGWTVLGVCRTVSVELEATADAVWADIDVGHDDAIGQLAWLASGESPGTA